MSDPTPLDAGRTARADDERAADHATIERLSTELLPALIAKLGATGLGELEVREGDWRVRLRRPADGGPPGGRSRRATERDRSERADRGDRSGRQDRGRDATDEHAGERSARSITPSTDGGSRGRDRVVATSPAVGVFQPRPDLAAGARVKAGDRLGSVDLLGVPQDVVAPGDGVLGATLVTAGDAVEYGQDLLVIEFAAIGTPPVADAVVLPDAGNGTNGTRA